VTLGGAAATKATTTDAAKVVAWGLVFYAGAQLVAMFLGGAALGALAVQAALAEWGAGQMSIAWSDSAAKDPPTWGAMAARAGSGAALGFGAGAFVVVFLLVTRAATLTHNKPLLGQLAIGLVVATLTAVRDELMLRGFVLRALVGWPSRAVRLGACALAGAAAQLGDATSTRVEIAAAALAGAAFAAVWERDRGAWKAVGAHTAWLFATGAMIRGGLLDVRAAASAWGGGDVGFRGSIAVLVATGAIAVAVIAAATRKKSV
jgi:hypothetical protein